MNIGIVLTSTVTLSSDQIGYLNKATHYLNSLFEFKLIFFIEDELPFMLEDSKQVKITCATKELTTNFLKQHDIQLLMTPYLQQLALCEQNKELVVCYLHQTETLYPCNIIVEADVFNHDYGFQFLNMMGALQEHKEFLVIIQLLKTNKTGFTTHSVSNQVLLKGKVNSQLYLVQASTEDVLRFEKPTCYVKAIAPMKAQWFTGESAGILYI